MKHKTKLFLTVPLITSGMLFTSVTHAGAVITFGNTSLGINDSGELNFAGLGPAGFMTYGVFRAGIGDAIAPGCPCEGWGVAVTTPDGNRVAGFANQSLGSGGLTGGIFGSTSTTATSSINLIDAPVTVDHFYGPSLAADTFQVQVQITNNGPQTLGDLVYRRVMDWDVPPTEFNEFVTHQGVEANLISAGGNVLFSSDNGFASSDPREFPFEIMPGTTNTDFIDFGPEDHGSVFDFAFGDLDPGESRIFNIFYGSSSSEGGALGAIAAVGADVYSLGQNSLGGGATTGNPATFLFAFGGVGGIEPGTTPSVPILPFVPAPGQFIFPAPRPRRWFDPPFADGFVYELIGGGEFIEAVAPPGFFDLSIFIDGILVDSDFDAGESFLFGPGVTSFSITGISPLLDVADPGFSAAFPTFLDFSGSPTELRMTAIIVPTDDDPSDIPVPATLLLLGFGLTGMAVSRKRKQA